MMTDHSGRLDEYLKYREAGRSLNNRLVKTIPAKTMIECATRLGFAEGKTFVFETEDEQSILMDYAVYYPEQDGRNAVANLLTKSPPPPVSTEMVVLQSMMGAYYSLFQVVKPERGVGVEVVDVLRDEPGFFMDVGFGTTARRGIILATRALPMDGFLMSSGASIPMDGPAKDRLVAAFRKSGHTTASEFKQVSPKDEAELAAVTIRQSRETGATSRIRYAEPGSQPPPEGTTGRRPGRNDPCPCGSGKKYKVCHGGHVR